MTETREYRYRAGVHGEHCIDYGTFVWSRIDTIGRAATAEDAHTMVAELNTIMAGTNAKLKPSCRIPIPATHRPQCMTCHKYIAHDGIGDSCTRDECHYSTRPSTYTTAAVR